MFVLKGEFAKNINLTKFVLTLVGLTIFTKYDKTSERKLRFYKIINSCAFFVLMITIITLVLYLFYTPDLNLLHFTNVAPCVCYCTIAFAKLWALKSNLNKANKILDELDTIWPAEEQDEKIIRVVQDSLRKGQITRVGMTVLTEFFVWYWHVSPLLNLVLIYNKTGQIVKGLPYYLYVPFDTDGKYVYPFVYAFHILTGSIATIANMAPDNFLLAIASNITLQFELLQMKIKNVVEEVNDLGEDKKQDELLYSKLVSLIKVHKALISHSETVEEIFSFSILVTFLGSSILICCVGFQATVVSGTEMFIFLLFLAVSLVNNFTLCQAGNNLIDVSNGIGNAAYNSSWYITDKKYRQLLLFVMLRAQRPQMFTALRFSVVSLSSYSMILRSAYSYFTLLQTTYKK